MTKNRLHASHKDGSGFEQARERGRSVGMSRASLSIEMPPYRDALRGTDLEDLVSAFRAASGMSLPEGGSPARRGYDQARRWQCFSCHGVAAAGGLPNPGSLTGFIPGWYGPDFEDLVLNREEFDAWIREGGIPRLRGSAIAAWFIRRQKIAMPR